MANYCSKGHTVREDIIFCHNVTCRDYATLEDASCVYLKPEPPPVSRPRLVIAIDPGPEKSAIVTYDPVVKKPINHFMVSNNELIVHLRDWARYSYVNSPMDCCVIEMVASYGMSVGKTTFETVYWIGRFAEAWEQNSGKPAARMVRLDVKLHLCHDSRAKDGNIRQALIDRFGQPGTKKNPGVTYGIAGDEWQALALAVVFVDIGPDKGARQ